MELFNPSKKILEMICENDKESLRVYEIIPFGTYYQMMESCFLSELGLYSKIIEFYRREGLGLNEETKNRLDYQGIHNVVGEILKNWVDHSQENSNIFSGFFFGDKGVCYGFCDGGDFFKKQEIKHQIENKVYFKEFDKNPRGSCTHGGFNEYIFSYLDFIEVDSEEGILYCVQLKENIIAPEGEDGSEYCDKLRKIKK